MSAPYDDYVDRAVAPLKTDLVVYYGPETCWEEAVARVSLRELKFMLADAWLSGLAYSLNLIEGEKDKRGPLSYRIHDAPKVFTGGKMIEPFHYGADDVQPI